MCLAGSNKDDSQTMLRIPLHSSHTHKGSFVSFMINTETKLRSAGLHVLFWETGCTAGETEWSTCQEPYLPSRGSNLRKMPGGLWSLSLHFPSPWASTKIKFSKLCLQTADGSHVSWNGERLFPLRFDSTYDEWSFILAPVTVPILGADFLQHYCLLVDMAGQRVLDASTLLTIGSNAASLSAPICYPTWTHRPVTHWISGCFIHWQVLHSSATPWDFLQYQNQPWTLSFCQDSSSGLPKQSFSRWRLLGLSAIQIPHGPVLYIWFLRKTVPGDPVETTGASMTKPFQICIRCFHNFLQAWPPEGLLTVGFPRNSHFIYHFLALFLEI